MNKILETAGDVIGFVAECFFWFGGLFDSVSVKFYEIIRNRTLK